MLDRSYDVPADIAPLYEIPDDVDAYTHVKVCDCGHYVIPVVLPAPDDTRKKKERPSRKRKTKHAPSKVKAKQRDDNDLQRASREYDKWHNRNVRHKRNMCVLCEVLTILDHRPCGAERICLEDIPVIRKSYRALRAIVRKPKCQQLGKEGLCKHMNRMSCVLALVAGDA